MSDFTSVQPVHFENLSLSTEKSNQQEAARVLRAVLLLNRTEFSSRNQSNGNVLKFAYDSSTKRSVVKVVDHVTGNILYQMPSEEVLRLAADVRKQQKEQLAGCQDCGGENTA
ncbi:MAG: flagellar protein FlaG [Acidobacteriota bacterium]